MTLLALETRRASRHVALRIPRMATSAAIGVVFPLCLLLAWTLCSFYGWIPSQILPSPGAVARTLVELWSDGTLLDHMLYSLRRVFVGFLIGGGIGLVFGGALGFLPRLRAYAWPIFSAFAQVNLLAWVPLLVLVFGIDEAMKYAGIAVAAFVPVTLATNRAIADMPPGLVELGRVLGFGPLDRFRSIAFPAALPALFTGLREGLAAAWQTMVIVELFASFEGLGYLMTWGRQLFQLELVVAAMLVIAVLGLLLNAALEWLEGRFQPWRSETGSGHGR